MKFKIYFYKIKENFWKRFYVIVMNITRENSINCQGVSEQVVSEASMLYNLVNITKIGIHLNRFQNIEIYFWHEISIVFSFYRKKYYLPKILLYDLILQKILLIHIFVCNIFQPSTQLYKIR